MRVITLLIITFVLSGLFELYLLNELRIKTNQLEECASMVACVSEPDTTVVDKQHLKDYLETINAKFPRIIYAQAIVESGHDLNSFLVTNNNNLFGMKHPMQRVTISTGSTNGYATYSCWTSSVIDYILWLQTYCGPCKTEQEVLDTLRRSYAEDKFYISKVESVMQSF